MENTFRQPVSVWEGRMGEVPRCWVSLVFFFNCSSVGRGYCCCGWWFEPFPALSEKNWLSGKWQLLCLKVAKSRIWPQSTRGGGILGAVIWGGWVITLIMFWSAGFMNLMLLSEFLRRNAKWKMNNVSMQFDPISQCARKCFATSARATFWCDDALPKCSRPGGLTPNWSIISKFLLGTTLGILQIQEIPQKFR